MKPAESHSESAFAPSARTVSAEDKTKIEAVVRSFEAVWNSHRLSDLGKLLTEDAEWVNVVGMWWHGRTEIVKAHETFHAGMFREVNIRCTEIEIREVAPGVAIGIVTEKVDNYVTPEGTQMNGVVDRLTLAMVKRAGEWLIISGHNTTVDPRAQPHDPIKRR
jgi:uncharacterized protein (TIGR02246 family)